MKTNPKKTRPSGFALIVTLSLMILLTVIAVGLLSLSSISLRSSAQVGAASTARNNARLGMMLALGELQASLGPDKAVSAPASSVFDSTSLGRPHLVGAWKSTDPDEYWHWAPTANGSPTYSNKIDRFNGWLVSAAKQTNTKNFSYASGDAPEGDEAATLVGSTTNGLQDSEQISTTVTAEKVRIKGKGNAAPTGSLSWAVFDESTKASVDLGDPETVQTAAREIASRSVPNRFRADKVDKNDKLSTLRTPVNIISLETATVPGGTETRSEFRRRFHDFTTGSIGLLTNTAVGGLKTDLTPLFESTSAIPGSIVADKNTLVYPTTFSTNSGNPRWAYLKSHYQKYKNVANATEPSYAVNSNKALDLKINGSGVNGSDPAGNSPSPDTERLLPVIAKFQLVFSVVSHRPHIKDRVNYWTSKLGANNFAVPHLVYDPVITLYNPYDITLNLAKTRIRVWDPPVGFKFSKIDKTANTTVPFRDPASSGTIPGSGGFTSLAQMQITKEIDPVARRCFTLLLTDGTTEAAGSSLRLRPGEVKVFSPRVQNSWTWAFEATDGSGPKAFFDHDSGLEFGNKDFRTKNDYGVETVPGWSSRAGLQVDHLATRNPRYDASRYSFERTDNVNDGFVTMRMTDDIKVEIKPLITSGGSSKDFQVDVLAGVVAGSTMINDINDSVKTDTLRSYSFNFANKNPSEDISSNPASPIISKTFNIKSILQDFTDSTRGGKSVLAMIEMSARNTKDPLTDSKPWLYNNPVVEGGSQDTSTIGLSHQAYDLRLIPISSLDSVPDGIAVEPKTNRGYFGVSNRLPDGVTFAPMLHVPLAPAASLGDLIPTNMISGSTLPRVVHPFGNARAHPLVDSKAVATKLGATSLLDHSYLLNDALWDNYYFSSVADYTVPEAKSISEVLQGVFSNDGSALNSRLGPVKSQGEPAVVAAEVESLTPLLRSTQLAKYLAIKGPFNVNSTSLDAWKAVLLSMRDREINGLKVNVSGANTTLAATAYPSEDVTPFVRTGKPLAAPATTGQMRWAGYKTLTDTEIENLAVLIVKEIKKAGKEDSAPPFSVGEFVNRRPGGTVHETAGLLQTAIDESGINKKAFDEDSLTISGGSSQRRKGVMTASVMNGNTAEGAPSTLTQGDLMQALAPIITVRGDTFKIRSYGEATNGGTVVARAWCEAIVQRVPDFVDSTEAPETVLTALKSSANINFGRRFNIVSFRWLGENEL